MNIFKVAFNRPRQNSNVIYNGFGFKHLSDVSEYYVHRNNQLYEGSTILSQPLGESMVLFTAMASSVINQKSGNPVLGDYRVRNKREIFTEITVPSDFRSNKVVDFELFAYKAYLSGNEITIGAYGKDGKLLIGSMEHISLRYKCLPIFCVLIARQMEKSKTYHKTMHAYLKNPNPTDFVKLCEDLYQAQKSTEYEITYGDVPFFNKFKTESFGSLYESIQKSLEQGKNSIVMRFPDEAFNEEQRFYVPNLSKEFVLAEKLKPLCNAVYSGDVLSALFHGPAGTGKTISCKLVCQAINLPLMETINCTENLDEFVLGKYIPLDDKIVFKESNVTKAIRDGGAVVFEEINFAKPQYLAFLNSLLDDNGFVRLDNGEIVKRHKNFRFFATMNIGYFGTKPLNQALYNRFNSIIEVENLSTDAIKRMLETRVPECKGFTSNMIKVYHKIQKKIGSEELDIVISPRNLENWARLAKYEGFLNAAEKTIIPIAKSDRVLEETFRSILMLFKWSA